jgi:hypothetical protein
MGQRADVAFQTWVCLAYHPCLSVVPHAQDDMMCYAYNEESESWHPWCLNSERTGCINSQNISKQQLQPRGDDDLAAWYRFERDDAYMLLDHSGNAAMITI